MLKTLKRAICFAVVAFGFFTLFSLIINSGEHHKEWPNMVEVFFDAWRVYWRVAIPIVIIVIGAIMAIAISEK